MGAPFFLFTDRKQQVLDLGLRPHLQKTLLTIDSAFHLYTSTCIPSITFLAKRRGISVRAVQYHLKQLQDLGHLSVYPCYHQNRRQTTNQYVLKYLNVHSAQEAARHNSKSCTPLKTTPKGLTERKLLPVQGDISLNRGPTKRQQAYDWLQESQTFRRRMEQQWGLVEDFIIAPREMKQRMAMKYMKLGNGHLAYREASERLRLDWKKKRSLKVRKASRPIRPSYNRTEQYTPRVDTTEKTGGWSSASLSSTSNMGWRD